MLKLVSNNDHLCEAEHLQTEEAQANSIAETVASHFAAFGFGLLLMAILWLLSRYI